MQVKNTYYYFKEALTTDQCQKIIDMGDKRISENKTTRFIVKPI